MIKNNWILRIFENEKTETLITGRIRTNLSSPGQNIEYLNIAEQILDFQPARCHYGERIHIPIFAV